MNKHTSIPRRFDKEAKCVGLLYYSMAMRAEGQQPVCVGMNKTVDYEDLIDMHEHHELRGLDPGVPIKQFACIGSTTYYTSDPMGGNIAPPCCEGIEFVKYGINSKMDAASTSVVPTSPKPSSSSLSAPDAAHQTHSSTTPLPTSTYSSSSIPLSPSHTSYSSSAPNTTINTTCNTSSQSLFSSSDDAPQELPPVLTFSQACQKYSDILSKADPLWFAKAFFNRAAINMSAMDQFVKKALRSSEPDSS